MAGEALVADGEQEVYMGQTTRFQETLRRLAMIDEGLQPAGGRAGRGTRRIMPGEPLPTPPPGKCTTWI